jgi:capsid protein
MPRRPWDARDPDYIKALAAINRAYPGVPVTLPPGQMFKHPIRQALRFAVNRAMARFFPQPGSADEPRLRADYSAGAGAGGFLTGWSRSTGGKWMGGQSKPIGGRITWHWGLRQQARDIVEDSVHAYGLVHRKADTVIDRGLALSAMPIAGVLGISEEEADGWAQKVNQSFELWARSKSAHRSGLWNLKQAMHQLMVASTRDNDLFVRLYYSQRQDLLSPLQWEIIDANQIRGDALTSTSIMPYKFYDGIVRNGDGSERAYKIWIQPPEDPLGSPLVEVTVPRVGEKSGRVMMIHWFRPEYSGQGRGYSQLGVSMQEFENLEDYILSIIKKAINQSQLVGIVTNQEAPPSNPFENLGVPPAGPAPLQGFGSVSAPLGVAMTDSLGLASQVNVVPLEEAAFNVPGSTLVTSVGQGDKLDFLQNNAPGPEFDRAVDAFLTPLLAAHGMSIELFKMKFEASYSAARGALMVVYRNIAMEREALDIGCLSVIYEMWLACEIAAGRLSCPGWADPRLRAAWCAHQFIGSPPVQIDPVKEADAQMKYLQMSATTIEQVTHERGGGDAKANLARNKRVFAELPIPPWAVKAPSPFSAGGGEKQSGDERSPEASEGDGNHNGKRPVKLASMR